MPAHTRRLPPRCGILVAVLCLLAAPLDVHAQTNGGVGARECCLHLLPHVGARAVGLGNALTARGGPDALFVNPAGLAWLQRDEFRVHSAETEVSTSTAFSLSLRIRSAGTASLTYRLIDLGEIEATDEAGGSIGTLQYYDHALIASFATTMGAGLGVGITYKVYQTRQDCRGQCTSLSGTTQAVDFGAQYHPPFWESLQLGAAVQHLGPALQVINAEQADPLPVRIRAGAAYELLHHFSTDSTTTLWASMDASGSWRDGVSPVLAGGLELSLDETIFVRSGYTSGTGLSAGASIGVGLRYERFDIGIAKTFVASTAGQDPYQITFAIGF